MARTRYIILAGEGYTMRKKYGFIHLLFDLFLVCITGGLWLFWLLIKFLRNGR